VVVMSLFFPPSLPPPSSNMEQDVQLLRCTTIERRTVNHMLLFWNKNCTSSSSPTSSNARSCIKSFHWCKTFFILQKIEQPFLLQRHWSHRRLSEIRRRNFLCHHYWPHVPSLTGCSISRTFHSLVPIRRTRERARR